MAVASVQSASWAHSLRWPATRRADDREQRSKVLTKDPAKAKKGSADETAQLSRRERKKAEIRRGLIEAAMELFREQGFADTTIEQITERVDVAPATFFNYFPSKEAVLTDYHRQTIERLLAYAKGLEGGDVRGRFAKLTAWQERRAEREGRLYRVLVKEFLMRPSLLQKSTETAMELIKLLLGWIDEGKQQGQIRTEPGSMLIVATLLSIWNQAMLEWAVSPQPKASCAALGERIDLLFEGLVSS